MLERAVPYDEAAEEALLGALILERDNIALVEPLVRAGDFYREAHGWIYGAILDLYARREPPDVQTIASELHRRPSPLDARQTLLDAVGGLGTIAGLMHRVPTAVHVEYYAGIVARLAIMRGLIAAGGAVAGMGYETESELDAVLDRAERTLLAATARRGKRAPDGTDKDAMLAYMEELERRCQGTAPPRGIPSGLPRLDKLMRGGARPGKLMVITGESGGGKSTIQLALASGWKHRGGRIGFFSLEMTADELAERQLAARAEVDSALMDAGQLTAREQAAVERAFTELLEEPPIRLVTGGGLTPRDITAQVHRWHADGGIDVVVIDYLQLVKLPGPDPVRALDEFINGLKALAMALPCQIVAGAQLSRGAVGKDSRDWDDYLRGSGAIKHAADIVLATAPQGDRPMDGTLPWRVLLSMTKHRGGPIGDVPALWWLSYSKVAEEAPLYRQGAR